MAAGLPEVVVQRIEEIEVEEMEFQNDETQVEVMVEVMVDEFLVEEREKELLVVEKEEEFLVIQEYVVLLEWVREVVLVADDFKLLVPNSTLLILLFQFLNLFDR